MLQLKSAKPQPHPLTKKPRKSAVFSNIFSSFAVQNRPSGPSNIFPMPCQALSSWGAGRKRRALVLLVHAAWGVGQRPAVLPLTNYYLKMLFATAWK